MVLASPAGSQSAQRLKLSELMSIAKRTLRVVKWLRSTPVVGICTFCSRQFKAPLTALTRTKDAQASLQQQFDLHKCKLESRPAAIGVFPVDPS
jgi:hypothetical protein